MCPHGESLWPLHIPTESNWFTLTGPHADRSVAVVVYFQKESIDILFVLCFYRNLRLPLTTFFRMVFCNWGCEIQTLSTTIRHIICTSEIWQIRNQRITLYFQRKIWLYSGVPTMLSPPLMPSSAVVPLSLPMSASCMPP